MLPCSSPREFLSFPLVHTFNMLTLKLSGILLLLILCQHGIVASVICEGTFGTLRCIIITSDSENVIHHQCSPVIEELLFPFVGTIDATSVDVMGILCIFAFVKHHCIQPMRENVTS
ncbi:hypothetical protein DPX16_2917 [Anabarilius grahami]|uniref:Uncharacterized protein n=1 Tax=Anabarilius grahami TaxID=495550 RepID=A0A3N0Y603_ANAGA|nr:hypothetical protein DPX16_2917 [Anabarilius grahami]